LRRQSLPSLFSRSMGCHSSKAASVTEPVSDVKTLLTSDAIVSDKRSLAQYAADLSSSSDTDVRAALQSLSSSDQTRLMDILNNIDSAATGICPSNDDQASAQERLNKYVADASTASESEIQAVLQGLSSGERNKLLDALNAMPTMEVAPPASCAGTVAAEIVDASFGASVADLMVVEDDQKASEGATVVTSEPPFATSSTSPQQAVAWINCCAAPTHTSVEVVT